MELTYNFRNKKKLKLSIIIITKNEELNIAKCINSIMENYNPYKLSEFEVIVIDSNSTDRTRDVVAALKETVPNLKLFNITKSSQYSAALSRSQGMELSQGEYILFLDGDMELQHDFLKESKSFLDGASEEVIGAIGIRNDYFRSQGNTVKIQKNVYNTVQEQECRHFGGAAIFIAEKLDGICGYDDKILASEEPELYLRIKEKNYQVYELPVEMINHFIDENPESTLLNKVFSRRTKGLGQSFYKTLKERRWQYLFKHKPLALFFIPFVISICSLFSIVFYFITKEVSFLLIVLTMNLICSVYMMQQKSIKKYIYMNLNFFTVLGGLFSYKKVTYEIEEII